MRPRRGWRGDKGNPPPAPPASAPGRRTALAAPTTAPTNPVASVRDTAPAAPGIIGTTAATVLPPRTKRCSRKNHRSSGPSSRVRSSCRPDTRNRQRYPVVADPTDGNHPRRRASRGKPERTRGSIRPKSICENFDNGPFSSAMSPKPSPAGHGEGALGRPHECHNSPVVSA